MTRNKVDTDGATKDPQNGPMRMLELLGAASEEGLSQAATEELAELLHSDIASLDSTLGLRYVAFAPEVVVELEITEAHIQPWGITNGGVYASLGESAGSFSGFIASKGGTVMGTTNSTNFLRPSRPGDVIRSTARAVHTGRTSQLWRIEHVDAATGKLCAVTELRTFVQPRD